MGEGKESGVGSDLTRRAAIKLGAAATVAASLGNVSCVATQEANVTPAPSARFFTAGELLVVDELSELIIPTDDHSPGARAANVAAYIDSQLAEAWDASDKTTWREGLRIVDRLSGQMHGLAFVAASPEQRVATLVRMAANEAKPEKPEEKFFVELKARVVDAYYSSEIGIKQEMEYKGNTYLTEFVGYDVKQP
jgi:hypothetical protein